MRRTRILHAPWNIGGNPAGLSEAERALGFKSTVLVLGGHPYGYAADINIGLAGRTDRTAMLRRRFRAIRSIAEYDVFHYNFGQTIHHQLDEHGVLHTELPWLSRMGKTILATFQGDDARPPEANPFARYSDADRAEQELLQPQRRDAMLRYADRVFYLNPDLRRFLPGAEFRPYASVDPFALEPTPLPNGEETVIAHAPSDRTQKGTEHVIDAVQSLVAEGLKLRLDLIERVSNKEVIERTRRAHAVIDNLHPLGWYGGYSVEAMALSRPVLNSIRDLKPEDNPYGDELPIVRTSRETLREDLRELIGDRERMQRVAAESRSFVELRHDPRRIARQNLEGLVPMPDQAAIS